MKIRTGFVSNSSSSSYVCRVCGEVEVGYNQGPQELGLAMCSWGHSFHTPKCFGEDAIHEVPTEDEMIEMVDAGTLTQDDLNQYQAEMYIPSIFCPVCQFQELTAEDEIRFLRSKLPPMNKQQILEEMRKTYGTYGAFRKATK